MLIKPYLILGTKQEQEQCCHWSSELNLNENTSRTVAAFCLIIFSTSTSAWGSLFRRVRTSLTPYLHRTSHSLVTGGRGRDQHAIQLLTSHPNLLISTRLGRWASSQLKSKLKECNLNTLQLSHIVKRIDLQVNFGDLNKREKPKWSELFPYKTQTSDSFQICKFNKANL